MHSERLLYKIISTEEGPAFWTSNRNMGYGQTEEMFFHFIKTQKTKTRSPKCFRKSQTGFGFECLGYRVVKRAIFGVRLIPIMALLLVTGSSLRKLFSQFQFPYL